LEEEEDPFVFSTFLEKAAGWLYLSDSGGVREDPFPAYTLGFPCGGGCCLQSPVLGTAAGTNYSSSMEFEEIFTFSSTQPIFILGEYVYSTLSQGIENFYGAVYKITRQWTVDFIVQK
jgi:hypothetical protein